MSQLFSSYAPWALLFGYLLGSVPFGLLLTWGAGLGDVRQIGSGSIGATNVLRTGRAGLAAATLLLDALKGTLAVLLVHEYAKSIMPSEVHHLSHVAALGALLGHMFPVWLRFAGGKGVATLIGVLLALQWPAVGVFAIVWGGFALLWRYSSLASLAATLSVVLYYLVFARPSLLFILVMAILIFGKHASNIKRLLAGEESKIGVKS